MKSLIITLLLFLLLFVINSGIIITLKPFSIKVDDWVKGLGWVFIMIGILMVQRSSFNEGKYKGYKDHDDTLNEAITFIECNKSNSEAH